MPKKVKFPSNFLWGVAYSSHQVEGGNSNNDWWEWEQKGKANDKSGKACDSWNRFREDHQLAQGLGCGGFRLSLEWSRIEPKEGIFSFDAIDHYRKVLKDLKERGMKRVVTLWHWPLPIWLVKKYGGWHKKETVFLFEKYCQKALEELGDEIDLFITMNEPIVPLNNGYLTAKFPPGKRNPLFYRWARKNMILAHQSCYQLAKKRKPNLPVGITTLFNFFEPKSASWEWLTKKIENWYNHSVLGNIKDYQDFVGIDYYFHNKIGFKPSFPFFICNENKKVSDLGWEIFPRGIYEVTKDAWQRYQKPIYIFENGLADSEDKYRQEFIRDHLIWLNKAIKEGVEIKGYFHWSLIDNFEWALGFGPRFGLCAMDIQLWSANRDQAIFIIKK